MRAWIFTILFLGVLLSGFVHACNSEQIDINSASLEDLDKLIWVGPATAQKIIDARPFDSVDNLVKVSGIGEIKLSDIKQEGLACVEGEISGDVDNSEDVDGLDEDEEEPVKEEIDEKVEKVDEEEPVKEEVEFGKEILLNENIINLNSADNIETDEIIYESKNEKIKNKLPYFFAGFLIFVIIVLLIWR